MYCIVTKPPHSVHCTEIQFHKLDIRGNESGKRISKCRGRKIKINAHRNVEREQGKEGELE
jgi:hypothetical protein